MIDVVAGVAVRDGRVLLAQRPAGKDYAFAWECAGGKVDGEESFHEALRREWREELGVEVGALPELPVWYGEFKNPMLRAERAHVRLSFYLVGDRFSGTPSPREGQGVGWFTEAEMRSLTLAPGNVAALEDVVMAAFGRSDPGPRFTPSPRTKMPSSSPNDPIASTIAVGNSTSHPSLPVAFRSRIAIERVHWDAHVKVDYDGGNPLDLKRIARVAKKNYYYLKSDRIDLVLVHKTKKGHHLRIRFKPDLPRLPASVILAIQAALGDDPMRQKMNEARVARSEPGFNVLWNEKIINGKTTSIEILDEELTDAVREILGVRGRPS